jgi:hypothetical protein
MIDDFEYIKELFVTKAEKPNDLEVFNENRNNLKENTNRKKTTRKAPILNDNNDNSDNHI